MTSKWISSFYKNLWCCVGGSVKQKLGSIKRVVKGWITNVKDLES